MEEEKKEGKINKKIDKKKYIILIVLIVLMVIATIAVSTYAYFSIANGTGSENVITSGRMTLTLTDGAKITAGNMIPGEHIDKTFTVTNTGNVATTYDVYLSEVINNFVDQTDLVYELISNDGGYNTSTQVQVPNVPTKIVNHQAIGVGESHTYTLRITFLAKNENQDDNQGASFSAKININEYSYATVPANTVTFSNTSNILDSNNQPVTNVQDALDAINDIIG